MLQAALDHEVTNEGFVIAGEQGTVVFQHCLEWMSKPV